MTKDLRAQFSSVALFVQEWLQYPRQIGAILPSSKNLSEAMAEWLPPEADEFVLELGPGTGSVTQALIERGLRQDRLVAIEKSPKLAGLLRERFPRAHIITGDALQLDRLLKKHVQQLAWVGSVISSLPLRNFAPADGECLAQKILAILRPDGRWVQYSYYLGSGRPKGASCFQMLASDVVWWNLPPARVSVYQKQGAVMRPEIATLCPRESAKHQPADNQ